MDSHIVKEAPEYSWKVLALLLVMAAFVLVAGCGGKGGLTPKTGGEVSTLAGTTWVDPDTNVEYYFPDESSVEMRKPGLDEPVYGSFEIADGILDLTLGLKTVSGTWDNSVLILGGKKLTKK